MTQPGNSPMGKAGFEPRSVALEANASTTTRSTRRWAPQAGLSSQGDVTSGDVSEKRLSQVTRLTTMFFFSFFSLPGRQTTKGSMTSSRPTVTPAVLFFTAICLTSSEPQLTQRMLTADRCKPIWTPACKFFSSATLLEDNCQSLCRSLDAIHGITTPHQS